MKSLEARRTVIVGDVHGCFVELMELLEKVELEPEDLLISVGNVVDLGPEPAEVVRFLDERPNTVVLMGESERKHARGVMEYEQEITRLQLGEGYGAAVAWMHGLPACFENAYVRVVPAAMVPGVAMSEQRLEILSGTAAGRRELAAMIGEGAWYERYRDAPPIAFGHHAGAGGAASAAGDGGHRLPLVREGRVFGLDTGACHGGALTALSAPDLTLTSVAARGDHWAAARVRWQLPVVQARPWLPLSWAELAEQLERCADLQSDSARAWLSELRAWSAELRGRVEELRAAAHALVDRIVDKVGNEGATGASAGGASDGVTSGFAETAGRHPAGPLLLQARSGRLDAAAMARLCTSPQRIRDFAAQLEVTLPSPPAPLG